MIKLLSIVLIMLLMIGSATAAVFVATDPAARLYFGIDKPSETHDIATMIQGGDGNWYSEIEGNVVDTIINCDLRHENLQTGTISCDVHVIIECDTGLDLEYDGTILDFTSVRYTDVNNISYECNTFNYTASMSLNDVTFILPDITFEPGYSYANIEIDLVGQAYGNYTTTVLTVKNT